MTSSNPFHRKVATLHNVSPHPSRLPQEETEDNCPAEREEDDGLDSLYGDHDDHRSPPPALPPRHHCLLARLPDKQSFQWVAGPEEDSGTEDPLSLGFNKDGDGAENDVFGNRKKSKFPWRQPTRHVPTRPSPAPSVSGSYGLTTVKEGHSADFAWLVEKLREWNQRCTKREFFCSLERGKVRSPTCSPISRFYSRLPLRLSTDIWKFRHLNTPPPKFTRLTNV